MVDDPVDRGGGGHRVLEDLVPLGEHQIGGDRDAAPLVAFGEQGEQHLHLAAVVLHVADVVQDQALDTVEPAQLPAQAKVALRFEEAFDQGRDRG